jgi:HSP20 family protein
MSINRHIRPSFFSRPATGFDDFQAPSPFWTDPFFDFMPVLRNFDRDDNMVLHRSSPGYEINEDDAKYQIAVDVPGVKAADMNVELEHSGHVLHLSGSRNLSKGETVNEVKFAKRFTIGDNIDTSKLSANLADGVLVVTAPKKQQEVKTFKIAITESKL